MAETSMPCIGFIGLGTMGYPMAGHLQRAGLAVRVYNRSEDKARRWRDEYRGDTANTPREAAQGAQLVMTCVGRDADLREVLEGPDGALAGMAPGSVLVDHSTVSADIAREMAERTRELDCGFLDAPVSGGQAGAEAGKLSVMVGGGQDDFDRARATLERYAARLCRVGEAGSGQLCKMVNQICIAGLIEGLAEGLHFAQRASLDTDKVLSVIAGGAAQSWQMDNRSRTMLSNEYDHGFAVDWMRKDLDIALAEAGRNGSSLPVTALVNQFYAELQQMGGGRWDTSSLLARLRRFSEDGH